MPPFAPSSRVEQIEFAISEVDAPGLEALLRSAGFAPAARHVLKPVSLWRQGDANLLINTDSTGFAHTSFVAHGTTVSEIGLRVADAWASQDRGVALLAQSHHQDAGAGQRAIPAIPAIRGIGGSVIRLLDSASDLGNVWEVDFCPTAPDPFAGVGITGIDDIAQPAAHDEMLSASLFYAEIFGARKAPMVDVIDPDGLARSQAVQTGRLRVTLNGAKTRRTLAGRFFEDRLGASVHHTACASDDLFATARAARSRCSDPADRRE